MGAVLITCSLEAEPELSETEELSEELSEEESFEDSEEDAFEEELSLLPEDDEELLSASEEDELLLSSADELSSEDSAEEEDSPLISLISIPSELDSSETEPRTALLSIISGSLFTEQPAAEKIITAESKKQSSLFISFLLHLKYFKISL